MVINISEKTKNVFSMRAFYYFRTCFRIHILCTGNNILRVYNFIFLYIHIYIYVRDIAIHKAERFGRKKTQL